MEENKMGVMPVNKLLISMALPMMISMLVQALYNIVDSMFVAQISENALTAVSLAFPAQNLMIAIGTGTGVGINALVSRSLGERNQERANLIANNGLALYVISGILFAIFGLLGSNLFFRAQTDDPEIVRLGTEYLRICCLLSTAIFLQFGFERILQATGRTFYTMLTQGLGAIVNIIMDPILIFGLFGAPRLGVRGAAIATLVSRCVELLIVIYYLKFKEHKLNLSLRKLVHIDTSYVQDYMHVSLPVLINQALWGIAQMVQTGILGHLGGDATAANAIAVQVYQVLSVVCYGAASASGIVVGRTIGEGNQQRLHPLVHTLQILFVSIGLCSGLLIFLLRVPILALLGGMKY